MEDKQFDVGSQLLIMFTKHLCILMSTDFRDPLPVKVLIFFHISISILE